MEPIYYEAHVTVISVPKNEHFKDFKDVFTANEIGDLEKICIMVGFKISYFEDKNRLDIICTAKDPVHRILNNRIHEFTKALKEICFDVLRIKIEAIITDVRL